MAELQAFTFGQNDDVKWTTDTTTFPQVLNTEADVRGMFQTQPDMIQAYLNNQVVPAVNGKLEKSGGTMTAPIDMGGSKITNVGTPTANADAATKAYVDSSYTIAGQRSGTTRGMKATAEGDDNRSTGDYSHAEGYSTVASGDCTHAEGTVTTASGLYSHAEGRLTVAGGTGSHAEGDESLATAAAAHAEGASTTASGLYSHAEGSGTRAAGVCAHAEGRNAYASGDYTHASGYGTLSQNRSQHVFGEYNSVDYSGSATERGTYAEIVGNGTAGTARSNARTLDWNGNEVLAGKLTLGNGNASSGAPTNDADVTTKKYVDDAIAAAIGSAIGGSY